MFKPIHVSHIKEIIMPVATTIFATEGLPKNLADFCKIIDQPLCLIEEHYPNIQSITVGVILAHIKLCEAQVFAISKRDDLTSQNRLQLFYDAILDYFSIELNALIFAKIYALDYANIDNSGIRMITKCYDSLWYDAIYNLFVPLLGIRLAADMADGSMALLLQAFDELQENKYQKSCYILNTYCTELIYNWQQVVKDKSCDTRKCVVWIAPHEHPRIAKTIIETYLKKHNLFSNQFVCKQTSEDVFYLAKNKLEAGDSLIVTSASSIGFTFSRVSKLMSTLAHKGIELHFAKYNLHLEAGVWQCNNTLMNITQSILKELDEITE